MDKDRLEAIIAGRLVRERDALAARWRAPEGVATRRVWVDDLLPPEVARAIHDAFPARAEGFFNRDSFREKKHTLTDLSGLPPILSAITYALQAPAVIAAFADLAGLEGLVADPSLYAAGLSMMFQGDFLNPHIDNSHDGRRRMYRRLNFLYYVSPDWTLANGGNFELWDPAITRHQTVVSAFNRLLVMETTRGSWHSVSPVVAERARCCVSTYVFSPRSRDGTDYFHVTSFTGRPGQGGRRALGHVDNALRQTAAVLLNAGRGRQRVNRTSAGR